MDLVEARYIKTKITRPTPLSLALQSNTQQRSYFFQYEFAKAGSMRPKQLSIEQ